MIDFARKVNIYVEESSSSLVEPCGVGVEFLHNHWNKERKPFENLALKNWNKKRTSIFKIRIWGEIEGYFCTRYNILNCQDAYFYVILSSRFDQGFWPYVAHGSDMTPALLFFFYTKYRRSHARSIVFKRDRLVRNLDKNIGARMHAGSFLKGACRLVRNLDKNLPIFKIASL